jgi:hypothetical protein
MGVEGKLAVEDVPLVSVVSSVRWRVLGWVLGHGSWVRSGARPPYVLLKATCTKQQGKLIK